MGDKMIYPDSIKFEVRQRHIDAGIPSDTGSCPIALALSEAVRRKVWLDTDEIVLHDGLPNCERWKNTPAIKLWISTFDQGNPVYEMDVELSHDEAKIVRRYPQGGAS